MNKIEFCHVLYPELEERDARPERTQLRQLQIKDQRDMESKKESSLQLTNFDGQTNEAKDVKLEKLLKKTRIVDQQVRSTELAKRRGPLTRLMRNDLEACSLSVKIQISYPQYPNPEAW